MKVNITFKSGVTKTVDMTQEQFDKLDGNLELPVIVTDDWVVDLCEVVFIEKLK